MSQQLTIRQETANFAAVIRSPDYQQKFREMLPGDVDVGRFTSVVLMAVQEDPKLMEPATDKASLFLACQRAAKDGLLPDKREGALVMYGNKVQWQPMIGGLRKRLAAAGFDLRAEVVRENDTFDYELGDTPSITHKPPPFGAERGKTIGAYAIATETATGAKYREVMSADQLASVAAVSRSGNSGPWKGPFRAEMERKTVARRLIKSLPIDDRQLQEIIARDNEQYEFAQPTREPSAAATAVQAAARATEPEPPADDVIDGQYVETDPDDPLA